MCLSHQIFIMLKKILFSFGAVILIILTYFFVALYPKFDLVSGFSSKSVASHFFMAGRTQAYTEKYDNDLESMNLAKNQIIKTSKVVTSSVFGLKEREAQYIDGLGVILIPHGKEDIAYSPLFPSRKKTARQLPYPYGNLIQPDTVFNNINYSKLDKALKNAFLKNSEIKKTRSLLVIYKDHIVGERYKEEFNKNSLFLGWSMTKSITSTVLGVLEKQGKITLNQQNLFSEWENDERKDISLQNLLNMNSGLAWEENYTKICDVTQMLFLDADTSQKQKQKELSGKPDNSWVYSSGTTNLLSGFIRNQFNTQQAYLDFWYSEFIDKIGMNSMLIETDYSGKYIGSSYGWATTRDWGKFGLLYLHNGNWNGEQVINKSWVDFVQVPTNSSNGDYGGHFWLNQGSHFPDVPKNLYYADGFQGQFVFVFPDKDLVIVRTGLSGNETHINTVLKEILASFSFN